MHFTPQLDGACCGTTPRKTPRRCRRTRILYRRRLMPQLRREQAETRAGFRLSYVANAHGSADFVPVADTMSLDVLTQLRCARGE